MYRIVLKTCHLLGLALFLLFGMIISSPAQQISGAEMGEFLTWKYKVGVDDRFRYEYQHNFDFSNSVKTGDGSLFFNRFKISGQARLSDEYLNDVAEIFIEGLDASVGVYQIKPPSQKSSFDLHQIYVDIYNVMGSNLDFKAGRQEMKYGAGRLISASTWANRIRSFDAAVFHYHPENLFIDVFYANDVKYDDDNLDASQYKEKLTGVYMGYQKDNLSPLIEAYFLPQLMKNTTTTGKTNRYTAGLRIKGHIPGDILYDIELPYQFGKVNHKTIKAMAFHADVSHTFFDLLWQPKVVLEYNYASGDKDSNDGQNNTFNPLYQSTHEPYGLMDFFRWQNMREFSLRADLFITEKLKLIPQTNFFWLANTNDSWYNSSGTVLRTKKTTGSRSHYVGQEISLRACYDFTKNIKFETGYAHFFTGKFVAQSGANDDADWAYSQLSLKF